MAFSLIEADVDKQWQHRLLFYGIEPVKPEYATRATGLGVPYDGVLKQGRNILDHWRQVLSHLKKTKPDVIILHSLSLILPVGRYCKKYGCRLVVVEHQAYNAKSKAELLWSILAMRYGHRVVLLTNDYATNHQRMLGRWYRAGKVAVIPNGIDTTRFAPAENPRGADSGFTIGMASRLTALRDHAGLIMAFRSVKEAIAVSNPTLKLRLRIAGDGHTLDAIRAKIVQEGLEHDVLLTGNLDEPALIEFLQSLDIYVHASFAETMSTAIMQTMACGRPVVASDIPGINNVLNGSNGLLYPVDNHQALAKEIMALLENNELRAAISKEGRNFALANFSASGMMAQYRLLIDSLY